MLNESQSTYLLRNKRAATTFLLILTSTLLGYLPEIVVFELRINFACVGTDEDITVLFTVATFTKILTTVVNPIIYCWGTFSYTFGSTMLTKVQKSAKKNHKRGNLMISKKQTHSDQKMTTIVVVVAITIIIVFLFILVGALTANQTFLLPKAIWPTGGAVIGLGGKTTGEGN